MNKLKWHELDGIWKAKCGRVLMFEVYWNKGTDPKGSNLPPYHVQSHLEGIKLERYRSIEDAQHQCARAFQYWLDAADLS